MQPRQSIILLDGNAPWVRSLFAPLDDQFDIYAFRARSGTLGTISPIRQFFSWKPQPDGIFDRNLIVPGWHRFFDISTGHATRTLSKAVRKMGNIAAIVYTLPHYAQVAENLKGRARQIYYAHDVFRFYEWDRDVTAERERQMIEACDASAAVAPALANDLETLSGKHVSSLPTGASDLFIAALQQPQSVPDDLTKLPRPIIGCTGQINGTYDWALIAALADAFESASFALVGPLAAEKPEVKAIMDATLARPNIHVLGNKPHEELPAYLASFNVCLNPLAPGEHADRRSPLRLYDYLCTDKPILSTDVACARDMGALVEIFHNDNEAIGKLCAMLDGKLQPDLAARKAFIAHNGWSTRAQAMLQLIAAGS